MKWLLVIGSLCLIPLSSFSFDLDRIEVVRGEAGRVAEVTLVGRGFGNKPAPILYDRVAYAYERGVMNTFFSSYSDGQQVTAADMQNSPDAIWQSAGQEMYIQRNPSYARYPESLAHYYGASGKSNLHNPRIWSRAGTATDESKLYVSWWFKQKNDTRSYFQFELSDISKNFNPKEDDRFSVDVGPHWSGITSIEGRVVHYDSNSRKLHAVFPGQGNVNRLRGSVLTLNGGGSALLAVATEAQGSNKFIRIWDANGAGDSFRLSWTNSQVTMADLIEWPRSEVPERKWNHMEIFIDKNKKTIKTYVNSKLDLDGKYERDVGAPGHSPTIGLIGFDASVNLLQEIWMNDIYMDSSFRRITLGDAKRHSDVTHEEVQYFTKWVDGKISFKVNLAGLDRKRPKYIYIYSEDGVVNQEGIRFQSPPRMPKQ